MANSTEKLSRNESRNRLKRAITARLTTLAGGEALPPVRSLVEEYGTSVTRLNGLFSELEKEGLIERRPGVGIFKPSVDASSGIAIARRVNSDCIHVVVLLDSWPDGTHSFGANLFGLMRQQVFRSDKKYHLTCEFCDFATHGQSELDALSSCNDVDAIVAMPYSPQGLELMQAYQPVYKPVFCFFRNAENPCVPSIYIDYYSGALRAVEHLLVLGHRRIGYIGMPPSPGNPAWNRERGYCDALKAVGLAVDPEVILHVAHNHQEICQAVKHLLTQENPVTALFSADGVLASAVLHGLAEMNINIPEDITLLSYDDVPECSTYRTPISVVHQPLEKAIESLLNEVYARVKRGESNRHDISIMPELLLRESCSRRNEDQLCGSSNVQH